MIKLLKYISYFIRDTIMFIIFLLRLCYHKCFHNPIKKKYTGTVAVLANGPSLKEVIPLLTKDEAFKNVDFIAMNFFALDDVFFKIKPKHYCLADPMFHMDSIRIQEVRKLFTLMQEKIDWEINLYILKTYPDFLRFSNLTNKNVHIIKVNNILYSGYNLFRNFFITKNLAMPRLEGSVALLAIFVCINSGYSNIRLYGVDHNFFDSLCVNENNQLCNKATYFYDKETVKLSPIYKSNGEIWKISEYIMEKGWLFTSHDLLASYAEYMNVNIINCTKNSLIDSYKRFSASEGK